MYCDVLSGCGGMDEFLLCMLELCYLQSGMSKGVGLRLASLAGRTNASVTTRASAATLASRMKKKTALLFAARFECCCPQCEVMQL